MEGEVERLASEEGCARLVMRNFGGVDSRRRAAEAIRLVLGARAASGASGASGGEAVVWLAVFGRTAETGVRHEGTGVDAAWRLGCAATVRGRTRRWSGDACEANGRATDGGAGSERVVAMVARG